jgi:hypothetical protein
MVGNRPALSYAEVSTCPPVGITRSLQALGSAALHSGTGPALRSGLQKLALVYMWLGYFSVQGH